MPNAMSYNNTIYNKEEEAKENAIRAWDRRYNG